MDSTMARLVDDPSHVPGIYNYCDRWCERCESTSRCLEYAMLAKDDAAHVPDDLDDKMFWDELAETLESALQMLKDIAVEHGLPASDINTPASTSGDDSEFGAARQDSLPAKAADYMHAVDSWFRSEGQALQSVGVELAEVQNMELPGSETDANAINNCLEVIQWYRFQIHVKLVMAVMNSTPDETGEMPSGLKPEGIAKVALIGIDRSIAAWARMRDHLPECADSILDMLVSLDRIRRMADARFPLARSFVRPGLDDKTG